MRHRVPVDATPAWFDVSCQAPCPECAAASGCSVLEDGSFARCGSTVSRWPILEGGWLHALEPPERPPPVAG
jgi:hypothetical protein